MLLYMIMLASHLLSFLLLFQHANSGNGYPLSPCYHVLNRPTRQAHFLTVVHGGVLSQSEILNGIKKKKSSRGNLSRNEIPIRMLPEAIDEAIYRQEQILSNLDKELLGKTETDSDRIHLSIQSRRENVEYKIEKLKGMRSRCIELQEIKNLEEIKIDFINLGFHSILKQSPNVWKIRQHVSNEYGRPRGFDGLVFYSPKGVPILVGRPKTQKDEVLRRIAQGADLWFQVEDYNGARVLLRTSLKRGLRGSKECIQMAANLAAKYSDWWENAKTQTSLRKERIHVMYTDSKHVAKRGSKIGQMRRQKSLGRIYGYPEELEDII